MRAIKPENLSRELPCCITAATSNDSPIESKERSTAQANISATTIKLCYAFHAGGWSVAGVPKLWFIYYYYYTFMPCLPQTKVPPKTSYELHVAFKMYQLSGRACQARRRGKKKSGKHPLSIPMKTFHSHYGTLFIVRS